MNSASFRKSSYRHALIAAAAAAGMGIGTAGAATNDASIPQGHSDSMSAELTDTVITAKVKGKLLDQASLKSSHIMVTTTNGVVTLVGSASSAHAKSVAEAAANAVGGVKSVNDELTIAGRTPATAKTQQVVATTERVVSDSWITTEVKSRILADSVTKGFEVGVETTHGVVSLKGALASQAAIADVKHTAQGVKGVRSVDTSALTVAEK